MKTGTLEIIRRLHCPHCGNAEEVNADEVEQYQTFEFNEVDDPGTFQIWKCLACKDLFKIYFP